MSRKIGLIEVKKALKDSRFRQSLPKSLEKEVDEFLNNPGCPCHVPLYKKIIKECAEQLEKYYPSSEIGNLKCMGKEISISNTCTTLEKISKGQPYVRKRIIR